jgi:tripartite-type tricarboxylate transporter receptor subunit TctC
VLLQEGAVRLPDLPDVPTARGAGLDLKGFRERSWFGLLAPKGSPPDALERISQEAAMAAADADLKVKLLGVARIAEHQSPGQFGKQVNDDRIFFANLVKDLDIRLE